MNRHVALKGRIAVGHLEGDRNVSLGQLIGSEVEEGRFTAAVGRRLVTAQGSGGRIEEVGDDFRVGNNRVSFGEVEVDQRALVGVVDLHRIGRRIQLHPRRIHRGIFYEIHSNFLFQGDRSILDIEAYIKLSRNNLFRRHIVEKGPSVRIGNGFVAIQCT